MGIECPQLPWTSSCHLSTNVPETCLVLVLPHRNQSLPRYPWTLWLLKPRARLSQSEISHQTRIHPEVDCRRIIHQNLSNIPSVYVNCTDLINGNLQFRWPRIYPPSTLIYMEWSIDTSGSTSGPAIAGPKIQCDEEPKQCPHDQMVNSTGCCQTLCCLFNVFAFPHNTLPRYFGLNLLINIDLRP